MASLFLRRFIHTLVFSSLPFAVMVTPACAGTSELVRDASGKPMFELHFFDQGERYGQYESAEYPNVSSWTLDAAQKKAVGKAVSLWADILGPGSVNTAPVTINIGTFDDENADAGSVQNQDATGNAGYTGMAGSLILNRAAENAAQIRVGTFDFSIPEHFSPIPSTGGTDLVAVLYHEVGHALGMLSWAQEEGNQWQVKTPSLWDTHLVDQYGTRLGKIMLIVPGNASGRPGTDFIVGAFNQSGVVFRGEHVSGVLNGALGNSLPIEGFEWDIYGNLSADLSHIELERGLMSHQSYRNYTTFMEAEMATLQDIGYTIDRRNLFGYSVYGDDLTLTNTNGYFARNAAGTAYLPGQANTATLGIGLHLYGKRNDVTQVADLLAGGTAGTGIRVDGSANTVRIDPGVQIAASGEWGTGLLVSYGKEHTVISRGDIEAEGYGGIGARFDFGNNVLGNEAEYRGSWIRQSRGYSLSVTGDDDNGFALNLDGPLVKRFDVSGKLSGSAAAIYIAENAFVQNINIMAGADVSGNIVSRWNPDNPDIQYTGNRADLRTALTFGLKADDTGAATVTPDTAFSMALKGGIYGGNSIDMSLAAGRLDVGTLDVHSLQNDGYLSLYGVNADGKSATVMDNFTNSASATLETAFTSSGKTIGITAASASLDGTWRIRPAASFYRDDTPITPESPVAAPTVSGQFSHVTLAAAASPTLQFTLSDDNPSAPAVTAKREADAYSRYAGNAGAASVGRVLPAIANQATGDMENLFTALDFSAMNGNDIRDGLKQLTPGAYDTVARESLDNQHEQNMLSISRLLDLGTGDTCANIPPESFSGKSRCNDWTVSVHPFGRVSHLKPHGGKAGYTSSGGGMTIQAEKTASNGLSLAFDASLSDRRITSEGGYSAKTRTLGGYAGANALFKPAHWNGSYLMGIARLGIEDVELERRIAVNGYNRNHTGKWTGFTGSALAGIGKDWNSGNPEKNMAVGPLGWLEYAVATRGSLTESGEGASRLHVNSDTVASFSSALGMHAAFTNRTPEGTLQWNALAAWRHQWQNETLHTTAHFAGYGENGFTSATGMTGKDSLIAQIGVKATDTKGRFARLMAGSEWFSSKTASYYASVNVGLSF